MPLCKRIFFIAIAVLLLVSCKSNGNRPNIQLQEFDLSFAEEQPSSEQMTIKWDYASVRPAENSKLVALLNEEFNVNLECEIVSGNVYNAQKAALNTGDFPDIFSAQIYDGNQVDIKLYQNSGQIRTIPRSMIEAYAPNYAALLSSMEYGWSMISAGGNDECIGLIGYFEMLNILYQYPVYRLDWLESIGILPEGGITEIEDRIYFTDSPFTQDTFTEIMGSFAAGDKTHGLCITGNFDIDMYYTYLSSLLGMFGLNSDNINENGAAGMFYASENYKELLAYLTELNKMGALTVDLSIERAIGNGQAGWWCNNIDDIFRTTSPERAVLKLSDGAKLLIAPPMLGKTGAQGASITTSAPFTLGNIFFINSGVSDEKLARILEIYDTIAFDPELYVLTYYGFEGEDFSWSGEPYNSAVVESPDSKEFTKYFTPNIMNGLAGKAIYFYPHKAILDFCQSDKGRAMVIPPYKEDLRGEYASDLKALNDKYDEGIKKTARDYYNDVIQGKKDVYATWDRYISDLRLNGLDLYSELINKYPYTSEK